MAEAPRENPDLTRALQAVAQNLLSPAFQDGETSAQPSKRKRPRQVDPEDKENNSSDDTMIKNYCSFGRIYSRQSSPFNTVDSIVNFGIKHEASDDGSDIEPKTLTTQEERQLYGWKLICSVIPGFRIDMLALAKQRKV